ncbi:hypothetical protein IGI04_035102, partial [Brassica rapa subsp. trilocularis]
DEPHIKLKLLTRRIHPGKPFVDPISDAPTLAETIHGADLVLGTLIRANKIFYPNSNLHSISSSHKAFLILDDFSFLFRTEPAHDSHHRQLEFPINQLAKEATRDPIGGSVHPARVRGLSAHLGGPVSTICKTNVILILRT